ncbi:MAG: acetyl-CoA carboxylase biotin carboxylase subunit, partial [Deltaproteobacteria bacterium]
NDCGVESGSEVPRYYDPMIGKLAVWAGSREAAIARLKRALFETVVKGITTNTGYLRRILDLEEFRRGDYDTGLLANAKDRLLPAEGKEGELTPDQELAISAAAIFQLERDERVALQGAPSTNGSATSAWATAGRMEALRRGR